MTAWADGSDRVTRDGQREEICRLCGARDLRSFVDLGAAPRGERFLTEEQLEWPEPTYPLHARLCARCLLVQLPPLAAPEDTFADYAYFSSYSRTTREHAARFVEEAGERLSLGPDSFVVEVASNDGYLLHHLVRRSIRCLGVEPSPNVGDVARARGVPTLTTALTAADGAKIRARYGPADLVVAHNVYGRVPDIAGFTRGLRALVADDGWVSIEVRHLLPLIREARLDAIQHQHVQLYTARTAGRALATGGLAVVDIEPLDICGGSIRLWARPDRSAGAPSVRMARMLAEERVAGLDSVAGHEGFAAAASRVRTQLMRFLLDAAERGRSVVGYGAPSRSNALLNYCGIRPDLLAYTVDPNPSKHGRYTPGVRIPVHPPERIDADCPDYVLVLPGTSGGEIPRQLRRVRDWGGSLVFPMPALEIVRP